MKCERTALFRLHLFFGWLWIVKYLPDGILAILATIIKYVPVNCTNILKLVNNKLRQFLIRYQRYPLILPYLSPSRPQ